jgi:hypothetical protein
VEPKEICTEGKPELQMPKTTVWHLQCRRVRMEPYKFIVINKLEPEDYPKRNNFGETSQAGTDIDETIA